MLTVVGIDPGLAATGLGVVRGTERAVTGFAYGTVTTSAREPLGPRLDRIFSAVSRLLQKEAPALMVVEDVFSLQRHPKSGLLLGKVTGVILLAGCREGVPVVEVPAREAKQVLTGNGNADKGQLERCIRMRLNAAEAIRPTHASDAVALAMIGLMRFSNLHRRIAAATEKRDCEIPEKHHPRA